MEAVDEDGGEIGRGKTFCSVGEIGRGEVGAILNVAIEVGIREAGDSRSGVFGVGTLCVSRLQFIRARGGRGLYAPLAGDEDC